MAADGIAPIRDLLTGEWLEASAEERLLIQLCQSCGRYQFYPRGHCVHCFDGEPVWHEASGRGRIHTYSVVRYTPNEEFSAGCPYVFAIVELVEGVRMTSRVIDTDLAALRCELPVEVTFREHGGFTLPYFTAPDEEST